MSDQDQNQSIQSTPAAPAPKPADQVGLRVSLIPAEESERRDPRKGFFHFLIAVGAFVVMVGSLVGFLGFRVYSNKQKIAKLDAATANLAQQSKDLEASVSSAKSAQVRLKALSSILAQHKTGLRLLSFLEKHTLPDVGYSSVSADVNGSVNLTVSASSFETYAAQINELRAQPEIKKLSASGLTPGYDEKNQLKRVDFSMSLTFDPTVFLGQIPGGK